MAKEKKEKAEKAVKEKAEAGKEKASEKKAEKAGGKEAETGKEKQKKEAEKKEGEKGKAEKETKEPKEKKAEKEEVKKKKAEAKKPAETHKAMLVEYKPTEVEEVIVTLANAGHPPSEIGTILRDQYGIPNAKTVLGKRIEDVLEKHKLLSDVPRDLLNLISRSVKLQKHMQKNRKDFTAKRGYILTVSKIRRLVRYYHQTGKLSRSWRYSPETAALLVK